MFPVVELTGAGPNTASDPAGVVERFAAHLQPTIQSIAGHHAAAVADLGEHFRVGHQRGRIKRQVRARLAVTRASLMELRASVAELAADVQEMAFARNAHLEALLIATVRLYWILASSVPAPPP